VSSRRAKMTRVDVDQLAEAWAKARGIVELAELNVRMEASACHASDVCVLDDACPFVADCRAVEARDDSRM
jgi:hypothetical protein